MTNPLARKLKELRKEYGLTLREVSNLCDDLVHYVDPTYISKLEQGTRTNPSLGVLDALTEVYWFVLGEDKEILFKLCEDSKKNSSPLHEFNRFMDDWAKKVMRKEEGIPSARLDSFNKFMLSWVKNKKVDRETQEIQKIIMKDPLKKLCDEEVSFAKQKIKESLETCTNDADHNFCKDCAFVVFSYVRGVEHVKCANIELIEETLTDLENSYFKSERDKTRLSYLRNYFIKRDPILCSIVRETKKCSFFERVGVN